MPQLYAHDELGPWTPDVYYDYATPVFDEFMGVQAAPTSAPTPAPVPEPSRILELGLVVIEPEPAPPEPLVDSLEAVIEQQAQLTTRKMRFLKPIFNEMLAKHPGLQPAFLAKRGKHAAQ